MSLIPAAPGAQDWLPDRLAARESVLARAFDLFGAAGYRRLDVSLFEPIELFARTAGAGSDVVHKEMYEFVDKGERHLALRPEFTAGLVRAYLEHGLSREPQPVKIVTAGTVYRYNRTQRGRYREFVQFDAEAIGSADPACDAELIALCARWFELLGLEGVELQLNSIDTFAGRAAYVDRLRTYLARYRGELSDDVVRLLDVNPLRAFDTKNERSRAILADAPKIADHLSDEARAHFDEVRAFLDARGVAYRLEPSLVRGLDYYTHTAWEFVSDAIGAQSTICGGGRYDGLAEAIGGSPTPGVGFAAGVDRILLVLEAQGRLPTTAPAVDVFVICDEPAARPRLHALLDELRVRGVAADADLAGRSAKGQDRQADRLGARRVVRCGSDEWARGVCSVRDRRAGETVEVPLDRLVGHVVERMEL